MQESADLRLNCPHREGYPARPHLISSPSLPVRASREGQVSLFNRYPREEEKVPNQARLHGQEPTRTDTDGQATARYLFYSPRLNINPNTKTANCTLVDAAWIGSRFRFWTFWQKAKKLKTCPARLRYYSCRS